MRCLREAKIESRSGVKRTLLIIVGLWSCACAEDAPVLETVLAYQRHSGGWPKNYDRKRILTTNEHRQLQKQRAEADTTIDNGATYTEIRLLAAAFDASGEPKLKFAALRGIDYLLKGQLDNGGWPQKFPGGRGYAREVTFNDNAMVGVMNLLKDIADNNVPFDFVPSSVRGRSASAVKRGISCVLKSQILVDGAPASWCAQHDRHTLAPCRGRSYELPSLSGSESVGIVRFLMRVEKPDLAVKQSIEGAVAWFKRVELTGIRVERKVEESQPGGFDTVVVRDLGAPPLWARFYDLHTNKPIFSGRDGVPRASLAEIPHERRNGYSWLGPYARVLLDEDWPRWRKRNRPEASRLVK
ncbi:MAG: pectate lyase [Roseibacillus sp.]|nr:pectate lyase [Roseibacillus sp.]